VPGSHTIGRIETRQWKLGTGAMGPTASVLRPPSALNAMLSAIVATYSVCIVYSLMARGIRDHKWMHARVNSRIPCEDREARAVMKRMFQVPTFAQCQVANGNLARSMPRCSIADV